MSDVIVVGAGSAGCVLASRFSENPARRVVLLEAGSPSVPRESRIPAAFAKLFRTPHDWAYTTEPEPALDGRALYWPRGRMLGGSSAMNAMIWTPAARADLDRWAALGNAGWSGAELDPALRRAEAPAAGGNGVGIPCCELRTVNPVTRAFLDATRALGLPPNAGFRTGIMDGAGLFRVTQRRGARVSAADAYLDPVRRRPNLSVRTAVRVRRILFEGRRAVGVEVVERGAASRLNGQVVLAAGAVGSPHLLLASGIGPANELGALGVPVVADVPAVGHHLQDHLTCAAMYHCREPVTLAGAERPGSIARYLLMRKGPLCSNVAEAGAFLRLEADAVRPDLELLFAPTFFVDHGFGNPPGHGFTIAAILLHPESEGRIRLRSADPLEAPVIEPRYLTSARDAELLCRGVELARELAARPELARFTGAELFPGSSEPLEQFIRHRAETLYHPVGTCRMGPGPDAVVTPRLEVHGIDGLWIADASVMPEITSGHTHAPTVMIAERAAELLAESL